MNDKIKAARVALGGFIKERRKQMGVSQEELGTAVGVTGNTINGIETGRFAMDIDLQFRIYATLGIKPYYVPVEEIATPTNRDNHKGKFLFAPDHETNELYILHRHYPACLIQVIQTLPVTFRIVDLYDEIEESLLVTHPFMGQAKAFWKNHNPGKSDN